MSKILESETGAKTLLRRLCVIFMLVYLAGIAIYMTRRSFLSEELWGILEYDGIGFVIPPVWPLSIGMLVLIFCSMGLLAFGKGVGYKLLWISTVLSLFWEVITGISITTPLEDFFGVIAGLFWGAILMLGAFVNFEKKEN
ncbi:MAG: hypothetical protein RIM68_07815 [Arenibacter sp.]